MTISIGSISAGRDINVKEETNTFTMGDFSLSTSISKQLEKPIDELNKALENKDPSLVRKSLEIIGKISIPALTTIASKLALKAMGL